MRATNSSYLSSSFFSQNERNVHWRGDNQPVKIGSLSDAFKLKPAFGVWTKKVAIGLTSLQGAVHKDEMLAHGKSEAGERRETEEEERKRN